MHHVILHKRVTSIGDFTAKLAEASAGDVLEIARGDLIDISPHPCGLIGCHESELGNQVFINNEFHHVAQTGTCLAVNQDILEVKDTTLTLITIRKGRERRKVIYKHHGIITDIFSHQNGGVIIVDGDETTQTIGILEQTAMSIRNRLGFRPYRVLHIGPWDSYYQYQDGIIVSKGGQFLRNGKKWINEPSWKMGYTWVPFEDGIAIYNGKHIIEQKTGNVLWEFSGDPENIYSCNGKIVSVHENIFTFFRYESNGTRILEQRMEPFTVKHDDRLIWHWHGILCKYKEVYKLVVIK